MKKITLLFTFLILIIALCAFLGSCKKECDHVYDNGCDAVCNECDESREVAHEMTDATCEEPSRCTVCGMTDGKETGHKWTEATCTEPKLCRVCGKTEGEANGHKWNTASCIEAKACTVCGATEGASIGHSWRAATCTEPLTCTACGATEGEANGHSWIDASCSAPKSCSACGAVDGEALEHEPGVDDSDCTTDIPCGICGQTAIAGQGSHVDTDADGVCDRAGCLQPVQGGSQTEEKEPDDNEGGFDFPMDPNP